MLAEWRRDQWLGWLSNNKIGFALGVLLPSLFLIAVVVWQIKPIQFVRTQKTLIDQYMELRKGSEDRLVYLWEKPFSAQFYTLGTVGELANVEEFQAAMDNPKQIFYACPKRSWADMPDAIRSHLQPVGVHNGYLLLYRFNRPE